MKLIDFHCSECLAYASFSCDCSCLPEFFCDQHIETHLNLEGAEHRVKRLLRKLTAAEKLRLQRFKQKLAEAAEAESYDAVDATVRETAERIYILFNKIIANPARAIAAARDEQPDGDSES